MALLRGRYNLERVLGQGGFGQTWLAIDLDWPEYRPCVVKQLQPQFSSLQVNDPQSHKNALERAVALFKREADTLSRLGKHPQIPELYAYFEDQGQFYLVQEYIPGTLLSEQLQTLGVLDQGQVIPLLVEILEVLQFVHENGAIHRDLKPNNIIRHARTGRLVLIDFGAVKQISLDPETDDRTTAIGTRGYMPIEQMKGYPGFSSDVYAVGMIGIQALTGHPPQTLEEDPETEQILWQNHVQILSPDLANILEKMTHPSHRKRYQTAGEALQDLLVLKSELKLELKPELEPEHRSQTGNFALQVQDVQLDRTQATEAITPLKTTEISEENPALNPPNLAPFPDTNAQIKQFRNRSLRRLGLWLLFLIGVGIGGYAFLANRILNLETELARERSLSRETWNQTYRELEAKTLEFNSLSGSLIQANKTIDELQQELGRKTQELQILKERGSITYLGLIDAVENDNREYTSYNTNSLEVKAIPANQRTIVFKDHQLTRSAHNAFYMIDLNQASRVNIELADQADSDLNCQVINWQPCGIDTGQLVNTNDSVTLDLGPGSYGVQVYWSNTSRRSVTYDLYLEVNPTEAP